MSNNTKLQKNYLKILPNIIVIDDNKSLNNLIQKTLQREGFHTEGILSGADALTNVTDNQNSILLLDYDLSDMSGKEVIVTLAKRNCTVPFIIVTGQGNEKIAVEMMKLGARDYIVKDKSLTDILPTVINRVVKELAQEKQLLDTRKALQESEKQLADSQRVAHLGSWEWNIVDNKITWSDELYRIFGLKPQEFEATYEAFLDMVHPDDRKILDNAVGKSLAEKSSYHVDARIIRPDGTEWIMEARGKVTCDDSGTPVLMGGTAQDITDRKRMEEELRAATLTDFLTGLLNRRGFYTLANQQCKLASRSNRAMALLYLDLDGFKNINDELGHEAGDQVLVDTANILKSTFREADIISRIGGDEFAVLLTDLPNTVAMNTINSHLQDNIRKHNEQGTLNYELIISCGEAYYDPEHPCSINKLLNEADYVMYHNKKKKEI